MASKVGVGNALLYIGLPWHKRKSYARDSAGFEPIEEYFKAKNIEESGTDTDSDSSETDTEELIRQIKQDREKTINANARKRAVSAAEQKAVARQQNANQKQTTHQQKKMSPSVASTSKERSSNQLVSVQSSDSGTAEDMDANDDVVEIPSPSKHDETATKSGVIHNCVSRSISVNSGLEENEESRGGTCTSEQMYSTRNVSHTLTPAVTEDPTRKSRLLPSRLTFSASSSEEDANQEGGADSATSDTPKSTKSRRKTRQRVVLSSKKQPNTTQTTSTSTKTHQNVTSSPIPIPDSDPIPDIAGETEIAGSSSGVEVDTISLGNDMTVFDPPKNSTEVSERTRTSGRRRGRKPKATMRKVSSIPGSSRIQHLIESDSSDSEMDESLNVFLRDNISPFHGLSRLAKQRAVSVESGESPLTLRLTTRAMSEEGTTSSVGVKRNGRKNVKDLELTQVNSEKVIKQSKSVGRKSTAKKTGTKRKSANNKVSSDTPVVMKSSTAKKTATSKKKMETEKNQREKKALKEKATKRKSVTFMTDTTSSEHEGSSIKRTGRLRKRTRKALAMSDSPEDSSSKHTQRTSVTPPKTTDTLSSTSKRKSILKNVSVVLTRAVSSPSQSPGSTSWFVPPDPSRIRRKESDENLNKMDSTESKRKRRSTAKQTAPTETCSSLSTHSEMTEDVFAVDDPITNHDILDHSDDNDRGLPIDSLHSPHNAPSHIHNLQSDEESPDQPSSSSSLSSAGSKRTKGATSVAQSSSIDVSVLPKLNKRKRKANVVPLNLKKKRKRNSEKNGDKLTPGQQQPSTKEGEAQDDNHVYSFSSDEDGLEITESPGGRKYRRLRVQGATRRTPGVRRSQRTRIAPVKHWLNEQPEYNMKRRSGISLKGVLVPMDDPDDNPPKPKRKKATRGKGGSSQMTDGDYPPLQFTDEMGNENELTIIHTVMGAHKVDCSGNAASGDSDVVVSKLTTCGEDVAIGHLTFNALGEKSKCVSSEHSLLFYVIKGGVHFQVNGQDYRLHEGTTINIPAESVYSIYNVQRSKAEVLYITVFNK